MIKVEPLSDDSRRRFLFRLCTQLGVLHPDHLTAILSRRQIDEWIEYYTLEPFGEERAELRNARLCVSVLQPHSRKKLKEKDFIFSFEKPKPLTPEQFKEKALRHFARLGCTGLN